jgi:hypothetical protein
MKYTVRNLLYIVMVAAKHHNSNCAPLRMEYVKVSSNLLYRSVEGSKSIGGYFRKNTIPILF